MPAACAAVNSNREHTHALCWRQARSARVCAHCSRLPPCMTAANSTCVGLPVHGAANCAFTVAEWAVELRLQLRGGLSIMTSSHVSSKDSPNAAAVMFVCRTVWYAWCMCGQACLKAQAWAVARRLQHGPAPHLLGRGLGTAFPLAHGLAAALVGDMLPATSNSNVDCAGC